jgi:hypothetical protein
MTLRTGDLKDLVYRIMEIDSYKSKMGNDKDIITLSFSTLTKESADDLMVFIEKGYEFVLDSDATAGEQSDGTYKVFVEIERSKDAPEQILEIIDGVLKLADLENLKFRYYKTFKSLPVTLENLKAIVPTDSESYGAKVNESVMDNYKNFFNRSFVESIDMWDDIIKIKKKFADPVYFKFVEFGDKTDIMNNLTESLNFNDFAEVIFLSKYIGDYNITKYGNKLTFENQDKTLVVTRIQT